MPSIDPTPTITVVVAVAVLVAAVGAGFADTLPLSLATMHTGVAALVVVMAPLALYVHCTRFYTKGPYDWIAWLHVALFALFLYLAVRMTRRWGSMAVDEARTAMASSASTNAEAFATKDDRLIAYRTLKDGTRKSYDLTNFAKVHPGGDVIRSVQGKDLDTVWKENEVAWHTKNRRVLKVLRKTQQS